MSIDIKSLLMGKAMGGGGGGGGSSDLVVRNAGFYYQGAGSTTTVFVYCPFAGYNGKYALIAIMHRDTLTAPADCTLIDKTTYESNGVTQYVSVFKAHIDSDLKVYQFIQPAYTRVCNSLWVVENDFQLEKISTTEFDYFAEKCQLKTTDQTFFTFNAVAGSSSYDVAAVADGAWLNQPYVHTSIFPMQSGALNYDSAQTKDLRFFSGLIPSTKTQKTTEIYQTAFASNTTHDPVKAQVVSYTISPA